MTSVRTQVWLAGVGLLLTLAAVLPTHAAAMQSTVPGVTASSWQTNGTVWALAYANGVVYAGGDFTSVRPPGAAPGSQEVSRSRLAAFNATTGALITSFNHPVNASVRSLAASPDGSRLYVGGDFATVDGATRNRVAAFTTATGTLTSWAPSVTGRVGAIVATASTVYLGGSVSRVSGVNRNNVAALDAVTGTVRTAFAPVLDNVVYNMALSNAGDRLYLVGAFTAINGDTSQHAAAALDPVTGAILPFAAASVIPPKTAACIVEAKTVVTNANGAYFGVEGTGGGCFDGTFSANNDGSLRWVSRSLGATQTIQIVGNLLYIGCHCHDDSADKAADPDAFSEVGWAKGLARHLTARSLDRGTLGAWYPNTNGGPPGGQGPRAMATDGTQLFVGGEFTSVNGTGQQGLTRFSPASGEALPAAPAAPVAVPRAGGKVAVFVQPPLDLDDTDLVVRIFRSNSSTPIASVPVHSLFWRQPIVAVEDTVPVGTSVTYTADATEADGTHAGARSPASASVRSVSSVSAYATAVAADSPTSFWRLNETRKPVAASASGMAGGLYSGGVSFNQPGPSDTTGITVDGSSGVVSTVGAVAGPSSYSVEAWFRTTSTTGGKIIGFGNTMPGWDFNGNPAVSSNYDRHVYMTNDGRLIFGVWVNGANTLTSSPGFNDGAWHQVVATQGPGGMALFVDGARIARNGQTQSQTYDGVWRVGGDSLGGWPNQPSSNWFSGSLADAAVYDHPLAVDRVAAHYAATGRTGPPLPIPTDGYGKTVYNDNPTGFWRLDEASGSTAADSSDAGNTAQYSGGVSYGQNPAISTGKAVGFDGSTGNVATVSSQGGSSSYSLEAWFNTTTAHGGKIIGFGDAATGNSGSYDKHVYMTDDGRLIFGVYNGQFDMLTSPGGLNNGAWHHVVATQGASGMALYVDDVLVDSNGVNSNQSYPGYWRIGGDNLAFWPDRPTSDYFGGTIDEVAVYGDVLTPARVDAHWNASGHGGNDTTPPNANIDSPAAGAQLQSGTVPVTATATDNTAVTSVDLYVDGTKAATDTTAPYGFNWAATAGSHTLQVKASDAAGNVGSSPTVAVSVAQSQVSLAHETWTDADGAPWSSNWTTSSSSGSVTVQSNSGQLAFQDTSGAWARAQLTGATSAADTDMTMSFRWSSNVGLGYFSVFTRGSGGWSNAYRPRNGYGLELTSNSGAVVVQKVVNGTTSTLQSVSGGQQVTTGKQWLRLHVEGDTVQFRIWSDGTAEPSTWTATIHDTTVTAAGQTSVSLVRGSTNAGAKSVLVDDLDVTKVGG